MVADLLKRLQLALIVKVVAFALFAMVRRIGGASSSHGSGASIRGSRVKRSMRRPLPIGAPVCRWFGDKGRRPPSASPARSRQSLGRSLALAASSSHKAGRSRGSAASSSHKAGVSPGSEDTLIGSLGAAGDCHATSSAPDSTDSTLVKVSPKSTAPMSCIGDVVVVGPVLSENCDFLPKLTFCSLLIVALGAVSLPFHADDRGWLPAWFWAQTDLCTPAVSGFDKRPLKIAFACRHAS